MTRNYDRRCRCGQRALPKRATCSDACAARFHGVPRELKHQSTCGRREERRFRHPQKAVLVEALRAAQSGRCAACSREEPEVTLVLDHCHATGKARSLLCVQCNAAFGMLGESAERCVALADYARVVKGDTPPPVAAKSVASPADSSKNSSSDETESRG